MEEWRMIPDYEGLYMVSNLGRVKSCDMVYKVNNNGTLCDYHKQGKIMKYHKTKLGYLRISLRKNGKNKLHNVHRLVAITFIPNPLNLPQVNHKNEDKTDNRVENLEWCTAEYNLAYNDLHKKRVSTRNKNKSYHYERTVGKYSLDGTLLATYKNATETGFCRECIRDCCQGRQKTAYGFIWKYMN